MIGLNYDMITVEEQEANILLTIANYEIIKEYSKKKLIKGQITGEITIENTIYYIDKKGEVEVNKELIKDLDDMLLIEAKAIVDLWFDREENYLFIGVSNEV